MILEKPIIHTDDHHTVQIKGMPGLWPSFTRQD
jgi:hypothetical protein